jgi:integrase
LPQKAEGWVFPSKRSKSGHITTVARAWSEAREAAGLPKSVVLYCARHTFGTVAATSGNMFAVKTAMGHASLQTTDKYQHPGLEQIRAVMEEKNAATTGLRHKTRHNAVNGSPEIPSKLLEGNGGPARIRTLDQGIMSPLL